MQEELVLKRSFSCATTTLCSSVFASPACVKLAQEVGLNCKNYTYRCQLAAGRYGTVEALLAARDLVMEYSTGTMKGAAEGNKLAVLQFLHARGCPTDRFFPEVVARRGDLEVLRWIHEHGYKWNNYAILKTAASSGNVEMTAWVKQQPGVAFDWQAMNAAAAYGHTAICEYLHAEQCIWSSSVCFCAACHGHVCTLRWLHEHGCPWDATMIASLAAESGSAEILMYLQQEGVVHTAVQLTRWLNAAGAHEHLAAAQCLRQQGAEWPDALVCSGRVWSGATLTWARAEGCISPTRL
jgi:hypothetical protein